MSRRTIIVVAAVAAALVAVGAGAALAADRVFSPEEQSQAVIEDAAGQLGVEPSELTNALKNALENQIDALVDEDHLTEEQADKLKEQLDSEDVPLIFPWLKLGGRGVGPFGFGHFGFVLPDLGDAASYLGLTQAELRSRLADGKSLADIAKAEGKSVDGLVQALVTSARERIDDAVDAGKLTKDQAADLKADLEDRITDLVNRKPGTAPFLHRDIWPGFGFRFDPDFRRFGDRPDFFSGPHA